MAIHWEEIDQILSPIKGYEDLCRRWQGSFAYPFVQEKYNLTLPELADYTQRLLGGDTRQRYTEYEAMLNRMMKKLHQAGVRETLDLAGWMDPRYRLEELIALSGIGARDIAEILKYLTYWFIPASKYLSGLVREDPTMRSAILVLRGLGIRSNLDLLQQGRTASDRGALVDASGLPEAVIAELVNRADLSRLPWSSKATISNIIGAGYSSLAELANADPEQLFADFFRYGLAIGKNLKLGNEIENSYRIAKIVPVVVE